MKIFQASYFKILKYPKSHNVMNYFVLRNGAVEKATSEKMIACLERCVDSDVDIIFSEFVHDDGFDTRVRCQCQPLVIT